MLPKIERSVYSHKESTLKEIRVSDIKESNSVAWATGSDFVVTARIKMLTSRIARVQWQHFLAIHWTDRSNLLARPHIKPRQEGIVFVWLHSCKSTED